MTVAVLTDGIHPYVIGGMQKHSYYLCKFLAQQAVKIELYYTNRRYDVAIPALDCFTEEELAYITPIPINYPKSDSFPGHYLRSSWRYAVAIAEQLQARPMADLIYAKGLTAWALLKAKKQEQSLPPIAIMVHGYEMFQQASGFRSRLAQYMLRPAFRFINHQADYVFSYGGKITTIIEQRLGIDRERIAEVPTGIEADWLVEAAKLTINTPRRFVFVGRYERRKGIVELTQVLQKLDGQTTFNFEFIGPIPENRQLQSAQIQYHGLITEVEAIQHILQTADVLVVPSYSEGMPNVILEGMASGCAIIATDVGAISKMVGSANGWLIKAGDVKVLEQAIVDAIRVDIVELLQKQQQSLELVKEQFLWSSIAARTIVEFNRILSTD